MSGYRIQNRYQDEGWEDTGESYSSQGTAVDRAERMSRKAMVYGMTRVLSPDGQILATFRAGGGRCDEDLRRAIFQPVGSAPSDDVGPAKTSGSGSGLATVLRRLADWIEEKG